MGAKFFKIPFKAKDVTKFFSKGNSYLKGPAYADTFVSKSFKPPSLPNPAKANKTWPM